MPEGALRLASFLPLLGIGVKGGLRSASSFQAMLKEDVPGVGAVRLPPFLPLDEDGMPLLRSGAPTKAGLMADVAPEGALAVCTPRLVFVTLLPFLLRGDCIPV